MDPGPVPAYCRQHQPMFTDKVLLREDVQPPLIAFSDVPSTAASNPRDTHRVVLNSFDVHSGKVMRDFKGSADEFASGGAGGVSGVSWPNIISVYEAETFTLTDKKSWKVQNVLDFSWSPADPSIALFAPKLGGAYQPAKVSLFQIPGKE
ncbi:hypothetical protein C5167_030415 [Papaver somniferum]|nr:hypothetical protein C5167_030415 [Papaver somniferum]